MAANKKHSTSKGKASARANARNRSQAQLRLSRTPKTPRNNETDFGRFPGETPLTGEDRPSTRAGGKQQGYRQDLTINRGKVNNTGGPDMRAPAKKRRADREPS